MKNIFIISENTDLPNYLFLLLKEVGQEMDLSMSVNLDDEVDMIIIDTESVPPEALRKHQKGIPIVLFAYQIKPLLIQYTSMHDVNGIISLEMEASDILKTLNAVFQKEMYYNDSMISMLFSNNTNELVEKVASLTDRESEILIMMMKDLTNEEIAEDLDLSVRTVNAHKGNIMRKIGAKTTSGLIKIVTDYSPLFKKLS